MPGCETRIYEGSVVTAYGGGNGAGIGGGYYGESCGIININGGNITATGGKYAAGIGSSHRNSCSHIIISGGTIHATGGNHAAGIGSGWGGNSTGDFSSCGSISITNGVTSVTATKGPEAPNSIGAGQNGSCLSSGVAIGNMVGAVTRSPYIYVPLVDALAFALYVDDQFDDVQDDIQEQNLVVESDDEGEESGEGAAATRSSSDGGDMVRKVNNARALTRSGETTDANTVIYELTVFSPNANYVIPTYSEEIPCLPERGCQSLHVQQQILSTNSTIGAFCLSE